MKQMKKTILIMMVVLCLPLVTAIYGGDSYTKTFDECDNVVIIVNATKDIDNNEFILNDECTMVDDFIYNCDCYDGWVFNLTTKLNTINNYNITFNFNYTKVLPPNNNGGSSGGGKKRKVEIINETFCNSTNWNCSEWVELNGDKFRDCYNGCGSYLLDKLSQPIVYNQPIVEVKEQTEEVKEIPKEVIEDDNIKTIIIISIIVGVLILGGIFWLVIYFIK